jgi:lysozyme
MKTSQRGIDLIKHFEGVRSRPYRCAAGLWTVGVGHLIGNGKSLPPEYNRVFTTKEINELLRTDLQRFELGVLRMLPKMQLRQGEFDCIVSFSFNLGLGAFQRSSFRQALLRGDKTVAMQNLLKYSKARVNGVPKELRGLKLRRLAEKALFES